MNDSSEEIPTLQFPILSNKSKTIPQVDREPLTITRKCRNTMLERMELEVTNVIVREQVVQA
jgi:hypothetical protein